MNDPLSPYFSWHVLATNLTYIHIVTASLQLHGQYIVLMSFDCAVDGTLALFQKNILDNNNKADLLIASKNNKI